MAESKALVELGKRIRKIRLSKKLTQSRLAAIIDKDQQSIQRLEKGRVNPTYLYLLEVSKGLEVSLIEILEFEHSEMLRLFYKLCHINFINYETQQNKNSYVTQKKSG